MNTSKNKILISVLLFLALLAGLAVPVQSVRAATITVCASGCDYTTIQAAINAASPGDTINVAAGTYFESNIIVNKSVTLMGDPGDASAGPGSNAPVIDGGSAPGDAFLIANGVSNVTIQGFEIRNFTSNDTGIGNGVSAWEASTSNITIQDNYFHHLGYNGVLVGNDGAAGDHTNWLIKSNVIENFDYIGFELTNTSNSSIEDNVIHMTNPEIGAIFSSARRSETGLTIKDNLIDGSPSALYPVIYIYAYDCDMPSPNLDSVLIEGNTIASVGTPAQIYIRNISTGTVTGVQVHGNSLVLLRNMTSATIDATANWWGDLDPSNNITGTGAVDYSPWWGANYVGDPHAAAWSWYTNDSIQEAVDDASAGDTINVAAGTYNTGSIAVNKAITLQGAGPATTIITAASTPVFHVTANNVAIRNLGITHGTQLTEAIRVSATSDLTIEYVDFTNLANGTTNAYGINFLNSFSNLTVRNSRFIGKDVAAYERVFGIYVPSPFTATNFLIEDNLFSKVFTGVDLRAHVNGLTIQRNTFGPMDLADCRAAAAGIYIGDGPANFSINNVIIDNNTFTNYCRGVYVWDYADGGSIGSFDITNNTFATSIYSSAVRLMADWTTSVAVAAILEGPINIQNNTFTQGNPIVNGAGVSMIDIRITRESATSQINITDNEMIFTGPFSVSTYGMFFRGPITNVAITDNLLNGGTAGGASAGMPPTSGIYIRSNDSYWGAVSTSAVIDITDNAISGFVNGVSIYNGIAAAYGGLPSGASLNINTNVITGNTDGIVSGTGESTDAENNWWGAVSGPGTVGPGTGDRVSTNVDYSPWCTDAACTTFAPPFATTTTITADTPDPSAPSQIIAVTATVASLPAGAPTPTGTVTISGGVADCTINLVGGTGSCNMTFAAAGAMTITATYNPDTTDFSTSSDTESHTVGYVPLLLSPTEGEHLLTNRPTFDWSDVVGARFYQWQVSRYANFAVLQSYATTLVSQYTPPLELFSNEMLYWRVRSYGTWGYSAWTVGTFTTGNPPRTPALLLPAINALTWDYTPRLDWNIVFVPAGTTFDYYQVQVATDAAFTALVVDERVYGLANHEYTLTADLNPNTTHYWRVRSFNTDLEYSGWSLTRTFRTAIAPPAPSAPANDPVTPVPTVRPAFDWADVTGATGYNIQVSKNNTFTLLVVNANIVGGTNSQYTPTINLPVNLTLYWRVRAYGPNGPSLWSSPVWSFFTPNPPGVPLPTLPALNSLQTDYSPLLKWSKPILPITPGSAPFAYYQVQVATDAAFAAVVRDVGVGVLTDYNAPQYTVAPDLNPNTKYYWHVRAWNTLGHYGAWSATYYFRTALAAPILSYPGDTTVINLYRPPFNWADVTGATGYTIQVSKNNTFTLLVLSVNIVGGTNSQYTPLINLPANIPLYWRVRTYGTNGPSLWSSPVWSFTITP